MQKMKIRAMLALALLPVLVLTGCGSRAAKKPGESASGLAPAALHIDDSFRTSYEVFVYSFADSDGDGIGDLKGLTEKLDYINDGDDSTTDDLGCTEIWTMPIFPSPTYHKYDTTDYEAIDPSYGTLDDFDALVSACHERDMRLILDLAVNHTSNEHPWFKQTVQYLNTLSAGQDPDPAACPYVNYYNFSRDPQDGYEKLPGLGWYYEARFWSGMPDLNLDNPAVREEIRGILKFWLDRGVDGFRLDAVTSYYTEDTEKNIEFLSWLNETAKEINPDAYLVGECWEGQSTYAKYYASGIDSFFDFDFAGQEGIIASVVNQRKGALYFAKALADEEALYSSYNPSYVNAPFYTNHDMARSAGYYAYDDGTKTKFAEGLNLLQTGNAFIYYGEELGMKGSGKDENKRAAMYWSSDSDYKGLCKGPADIDSFEMKYDPEDQQTSDPDSILSYVREAVRIRNTYPAIARGETAVVDALSDENAAAFTRTVADGSCDPVLILLNTSEKPVTIDLSKAGKDISRKYTTVDAFLTTTSDEKVTMQGTSVTLPARSYAVLPAKGEK